MPLSDAFRRFEPEGAMASHTLEPEQKAAKTLLSEPDLAARWQVSRRTIQRWRCEGRVPAYLRLGRRINYRLTDILAFEKAARIRTGGQP